MSQTHDIYLNVNGYEVQATVVYTFRKGYTAKYECHGPQAVHVPDEVSISDIYYLDAGAVRKSLAHFIFDMLPELVEEIEEEIKGEHHE